MAEQRRRKVVGNSSNGTKLKTANSAGLKNNADSDINRQVLKEQGVTLDDKGLNAEDFKSASEDTGQITFASKEELNAHMESHFDQMFAREMRRQQNQQVVEAQPATSIPIATKADVDFYEYVMNQPKVSLVVPLKYVEDGKQLSEYKREYIHQDGRVAKDARLKTSVWELYIPIMINGWDFSVSLGVMSSPEKQRICKNVPLPVARLIAEQRGITFMQPDGEAFIPYTISGLGRVPLRQVTELSLLDMVKQTAPLS